MDESNAIKPKVLTEDLGKIFEKAICLLFGIEYDGKNKYSIEEAIKLQGRIHQFKDVFTHDIIHTAKGGNPCDFMGKTDKGIKLSAKTSKNKKGKVCPQIIGQPSKNKFCEYFGIDQSMDLENIKKFIEENLTHLLNEYLKNTFHAEVLYYNKKENTLLFIRLKQDINWDDYVINFNHNILKKTWNESTTIKINEKSIGEFQVHKHRDCIKFRWAFEDLLDLFKDNFDITYL
jgi:hypothetical protein